MPKQIKTNLKTDDQNKIIELGMCEKDHLYLRANQLYRFIVMPNCKECERLDQESKLPA